VPSDEPRWDPRLDRDPHNGHSFFTTPEGQRTYLVELKTDPPVRVTARLEKMLGKVHWTAIKERAKRGRPFSARDDYHAKLWAPRFLELDSELNDPAGLNGDRPLSRIGLGYLVACDDYNEHPDRWDYDPDANALTRKRSGQRVWKAVKPLI